VDASCGSRTIISWVQCNHGPYGDRNDPLDYYSLTHRDFETFLMYENGDETVRDHFKLKVARQNRERRKKEAHDKEAQKKKEAHDEERMRKKDAHEDRMMDDGTRI